jgi:hypothetical protein
VNEVDYRSADKELNDIEKQINERKDNALKLVGSQDVAICQICQKTKFADGIGHKCFYCQLRSCARCGGRTTNKNKVCFCGRWNAHADEPRSPSWAPASTASLLVVIISIIDWLRSAVSGVGHTESAATYCQSERVTYSAAALCRVFSCSRRRMFHEFLWACGFRWQICRFTRGRNRRDRGRGASLDGVGMSISC